MSAATVRFDDCLPILATTVAEELGSDALSDGVVLRDASGRLAFFANQTLGVEQREKLSAALRDRLHGYARADRVVASVDDPGVQGVLSDPSTTLIQAGGRSLHLLERRLVGADWLRVPSSASTGPCRFVFASIKGGVGRSTALAVTAAHLAKQGLSVLVIDLDIESPGLGHMLLSNTITPDFGILDALIENRLSALDQKFLADLRGPSDLAQSGKIDVVPVLGKRSLEHAQDILSKISRAYIEDVLEDGTCKSHLDQVSEIVSLLEQSSRYDVVLVDSRAGLHESTAACILGLGAEVLLFGLNEEQTFQGYSALFAHLSVFAPKNQATDMFERFQVVQAKAAADAPARALFASRFSELTSSLLCEAKSSENVSSVELPAEPFNAVPWDDDLPDESVLPNDFSLRPPVAILNNDQYLGFDPLVKRSLLDHRVYEASFGELIQVVVETIEARRTS